MAAWSEYDQGFEEALLPALEAALLDDVRDAKREVRRRVLAAARADARFAPFRVLSVRASALLVAVTLFAGGASVAAAKAAPGQSAYALKRAAERTALAVLPPGGLRDALQARFEQRRAAELRELMRLGLDADDLRAALQSMGLSSGGPSEDPYAALRRELDRLGPARPAAPVDGGGEAGVDDGTGGGSVPEGPSRPGDGAVDGSEGKPGAPQDGTAQPAPAGPGSTAPGSGSGDASGAVPPGGGGSSSQGRGGSTEPSSGIQPGPGPQRGDGAGAS